MKRKVVIISVMVFIVSVIGFSLLSISIENGTSIERAQFVVEDEATLLQTQSSIMSYAVNGFIKDLEFTASIMQAHGHSEAGLNNVAQIWRNFSDGERVYDQIRYIDADGQERIRVNYSTDGAYIVEPQNLQNKKDRYYFTESFNLRDGQIYISKLDLNIENGEIEQPIKPMMRIATPLISDTGERLGIIIVNYRAKELIETFNKIADSSTDVVYLLNENGYWLSNTDEASYEWTFMFDDKQDKSFAGLYPEEWDQFGSSTSGTYNSGNGIFTYTFFSIESDYSSEIVLGEGAWVLVSHISPQSAYEHEILTTFWSNAERMLKEDPLVSIALLIISAMSAMLVAMRTRMYERTRYLSEYDGMTKVYNRRTGMSLLSKVYKEAKQKSAALSVCFMDVNGLKEVNDTLGHEMGDELLATIVECINASIRKTDFLARIGGDEFLLILPESDKTIAESVWQRINIMIAIKNDKDDRDYVISVSHGVKQFEYSSNEDIDSVIQAADELMYEEKRLIKQKLKVLKLR